MEIKLRKTDNGFIVVAIPADGIEFSEHCYLDWFDVIDHLTCLLSSDHILDHDRAPGGANQITITKQGYIKP